MFNSKLMKVNSSDCNLEIPTDNQTPLEIVQSQQRKDTFPDVDGHDQEAREDNTTMMTSHLAGPVGGAPSNHQYQNIRQSFDGTLQPVAEFRSSALVRNNQNISVNTVHTNDVHNIRRVMQSQANFSGALGKPTGNRKRTIMSANPRRNHRSRPQVNDLQTRNSSFVNVRHTAQEAVPLASRNMTGTLSHFTSNLNLTTGGTNQNVVKYSA